LTLIVFTELFVDPLYSNLSRPGNTRLAAENKFTHFSPLYYRGFQLVLRSIFMIKIHFFMAMSRATVLVYNLKLHAGVVRHSNES